MDATSFDPFADGPARRWIDDLEDRGLDAVADALRRAADPGLEWVGVEEGTRAVAAAEVVAALRGAPADGLPASVSAWIDGEPRRLPDDLVAEAKAVVLRVGADGSELVERADAADDGTAWRAALTDLHDRLG